MIEGIAIYLNKLNPAAEVLGTSDMIIGIVGDLIAIGADNPLVEVGVWFVKSTSQIVNHVISDKSADAPLTIKEHKDILYSIMNLLMAEIDKHLIITINNIIKDNPSLRTTEEIKKILLNEIDEVLEKPLNNAISIYISHLAK